MLFISQPAEKSMSLNLFEACILGEKRTFRGHESDMLCWGLQGMINLALEGWNLKCCFVFSKLFSRFSWVKQCARGSLANHIELTPAQPAVCFPGCGQFTDCTFKCISRELATLVFLSFLSQVDLGVSYYHLWQHGRCQFFRTLLS